DTQPSNAAEPRPYCLTGGRGSTGGIPDCSYHTWEQCRAAIGGGGDACMANPELSWRALDRAATQPKPRRRQQQRY
ncbi:MAG: DUF3551 domain-containing protein, partial [Xanthobacteraceae bacterium]